MSERVRSKELAKILGTSQNNICGSVNQIYYEYEHAFLIYLLYRLMKLGLGDKGVLQAVCKWFTSYPWPLARFQELMKLKDDIWLVVPVSSYSRDFDEQLRVLRKTNG